MKNNWKLFEKQYDHFIGPVYRYIAMRLKKQEDAEDITSEIFMKALEHFDDYDPAQPFSNWIYTIARNHLINYLKKTKSIISLETTGDIISSQNIAEEYQIQESIEKVKDVMKLLSPEKQQLIEMRYISGYSFKEMGEILEKDENTIKVATFRSMEEVKKKIYLPS